MIEPTWLNHQFLIAMPTLADPNFFQTVTYIATHTADGAMGVVINRPLKLMLSQLLKHLHFDSDRAEISQTPVYCGGPVQPEHGLVLHCPVGCWSHTIRLNDKLGITTSCDILQAVAGGQGPDQMLVALGYAGWGPGQLEQELADNAWLLSPFDSGILFDLPNEQRWSAAAALLGIDLNLLSSHVGHA